MAFPERVPKSIDPSGVCRTTAPIAEPAVADAKVTTIDWLPPDDRVVPSTRSVVNAACPVAKESRTRSVLPVLLRVNVVSDYRLVGTPPKS